MSLDFTDGYTYDYIDLSLVDNKNNYENSTNYDVK